MTPEQQKQIDDLIDRGDLDEIKDTLNEAYLQIAAMREENKRLREALEEVLAAIGHNRFHGNDAPIDYIEKTAKQALGKD